MDYSSSSSGAGGVYSMFGSAAQHLSSTSSSSANAGPSSLQPSSCSGAATFDWDDLTGSNANGGPSGSGSSKELDLVFVMDCTGSMGSYIASATNHIETICDNIIQSEQLSAPGALRVGLVAFRDHPPQDYSYITRSSPFTSQVSVIKEQLRGLYASGGGDGPEAVTAALKAVLDMDWRPSATRLAVVITDAPPHSIGEYGDGFSQGDPSGEDPLVLARRMAEVGISLFMVACEPALAAYSNAVDFYQALVRLTSGLMVPLTTASLLTHVIIAAAGEAMALDRLHREIGDEVAERLRSLSLAGAGGTDPSASTAPPPPPSDTLMDEVARDLHQRLLLRNESTKQLVIETIYRDTDESRSNVEVWSTAPDVMSARPHLQKVYGSRLNDRYLATRRANATLTSRGAAPFPRASPASPGAGSSSWSNVGEASANASGSGGGRRGSSRQVVSDFSAFNAGSSLSFGSPPQSQQASPAQFGGNNPTWTTGSGGGGAVRGGGGNGMMDDDDDEDDEDAERAASRPLPVAVETDQGELEVAGDDGSRLTFRQGAISLDQAKRLARQSAFRRA